MESVSQSVTSVSGRKNVMHPNENMHNTRKRDIPRKDVKTQQSVGIWWNIIRN
jgi:hypothetical protein